MLFHPMDLNCRICGSPAKFIGKKAGKLVRIDFNLYHCTDCGFSFVGNPLTNYEAIYSDDFYRGRGADPMVDYEFELNHPKETVRAYEWNGILKAVTALVGDVGRRHWLDFGCGNGGLVRHVRENGAAAVGLDEGGIASRARKLGIPILRRDELLAHRGTFDIVTAIEVFEHLVDPVSTLRAIRSLMTPGALLFYTTGNARLYRESLVDWPYVIPEIHVSFYEPMTLRRLLAHTGFRAEEVGFIPGFEDIIRFKVLKNLRVRTRTMWERALPWSLISRVVDAKYAVTAHPIAWAD
jgi:SAM-dependent methyltransferase